MPAPVPESEYIKRILNKIKGKYEFLGWDEDFKGNTTKARLKCPIHNFEWPSVIHAILKGNGCPKCKGDGTSQRKRKPVEHFIKLIEPKIEGKFEYNGLAEEYKGRHTKINLKCLTDGYEWTPTFANVSKGQGCWECGNRHKAGLKAKPESYYINIISDIVKDFAEPLGWEGEFTDGETKMRLKCLTCNHVWPTVAYNLYQGKRCPVCAETGYNIGKPGFLYALLSDCKTMVKVGITNHLEQRHKQLEKATPFKFECIATVQCDDGAAIANLERELHSKMEQIVFEEKFDGFTEWMKWDPKLIDWLEKFKQGGAS